MDRTLHDGDPVEVGMSPERIERVRGLCAAWVEQGLTPTKSPIDSSTTRGDRWAVSIP
jgi:hypothetical protein